ncbi:MAG: type IV toxin-antitoxin system AbiEi family antitoxin [Deltaproteobacteria bacterium]|nr:type IV toxin-antitoxin system AbiEi family antitoxin [Deltaproteobacteria bacterium]MCL5673104.1 type IV toxin-antitoxin system AbiEi family antitoxin [Deltaproteobacteria bacterium]
MTKNNSSKLNHVILNMPYGSVVTSEWLHYHGVSSKLAYWYVKSNWLERISDKAYKKPKENIMWPGVVGALQAQLKKPVHVSGKSALALTGKSHYLPMGSNATIELATEERIALPTWFYAEHLSKDKIKVHQNKLLNLNDYKEFLIQKEFNGVNITLSCAELAILEVLQLVPKEQDFTEAAQLMESLPYLRPSKVQALLEKCTSIKAKRLYLYLASKYNHNWLKKLDPAKLDLGKGKRMIVKGGTYDPKFQITVPVINGE